MSNNLHYEKLIESGEFGRKTRVNSKRKGAGFERKIAKLLNERFNTKEFARTPGSGAFGTTHENLPQYFKVSGDLISPENFKFILECKNGYDVRLEDLFKPKSELFKFIEQAKRDALKANKPWLLIYKRDRQKTLVIHEGTFPLNNFVSFGKYKIHLWDDVMSLPNFNFFN
jgi:hypothetical protein